MEFQTLKKDYRKYWLIGISVVLIIVVVLCFVGTRAKYKVSSSVQVASGNINYSSADFTLVSVLVNNDDGNGYQPQTDIPTTGYTFDGYECKVGDILVNDTVTVTYPNDGTGTITITGVSKQGTKCTVKFTKTKDAELPVISNVTSSKTDTSISLTVTATDNVGVTTYYYSKDGGSTYTDSTSNSYTFSDLTAGSYSISIYVTDAAGNESEKWTSTILTVTAKDTILANNTTTDATRSSGSFTGVYTTSTAGKIFTGTDDYGPTYFFAGSSPNNWVKFGKDSSNNDLYWRIIRINGDGTIRLIYNGTSTTTTGSTTQISTSAFNSNYNDNAYVGYMYGTAGSDNYNDTHANINDSTIKGVLDTWYTNNLKTNYTSYLDGNAGWCGDRTIATSSQTWWSSDTKKAYGTNATAYIGFSRHLTTSGSWNTTSQTASFKCSQINDLYTTSGSTNGNKALTNPIGLITADEVTFAGGFGGTNNSSYWLYTGQHYWTMSPSAYGDGDPSSSVCSVNSSGELYCFGVLPSRGVRPVINLKANTVFSSGNGTTSSPYVVKTS